MNESQRLGAWTAAGWLGIIGGAVAALASGAMLVLFLFLSARGHPMEVRGTRGLPGLMPLLYADARVLPAFFFLSAALAFTAGLGLIRRRRYGRTLTLAFGCLSVAWSIFADVHLWLGFFAPTSASPSLVFDLGPALLLTPIAVVYCAAATLLCFSVHAHPEAFHGAQTAAGA